DMRQASYQVKHVRRGHRIRRPSAPFITSTMQQEASRRLGFTARRVMVIAQQLYEGIELDHGKQVGLITYMRTDSTKLAAEAVAEARRVIQKRFGDAYVPEKPPKYRSPSRRAQEAHEAIRPTSAAREPGTIEQFLTPEQFKLYSLIWKRFIASQMKPAEYDTLTIEVDGRSAKHNYFLRIAASKLRFPGFLELYDDREAENNKNGRELLKIQLDQLPDLSSGDSLDLQDLFPEQHFTQPPRRFSDATLVRALEEHGIGRPSTYAPIISTILQRGYVQRQKRRLVPTEIGEIVNDLIVEHFPNIVDLGFTARLEENLDEIAEGEREWVDVIRAFYEPFAEQVKRA
ncbi:MAG: type I DNA topoisomerase, partial [Anaerolineales bacterium]|nr:type I DNA topoisomerase [Anaerolineales bacterium]